MAKCFEMQSYNDSAYVCVMNSENKFQSDGFSSSRFLRLALWRHYWHHLLAGALVWVMLGLGWVACYNLSNGRAAFNLVNSDRQHDVAFVARIWAAWGSMYLLSALIPAAVGGLLRMPLLARISGHAGSRESLVGWSLLAFEASGVLASLGYWWLTGAAYTGLPYQKLAHILAACFVISLPWLLSTAWASWRLASELRIPPREATPIL